MWKHAIFQLDETWLYYVFDVVHISGKSFCSSARALVFRKEVYSNN